MTSAVASGALRQFEHFAIDASRGAVLRDGETITLRPQSFRVLQYLAANPGRLISKEELFDRIWGEPNCGRSAGGTSPWSSRTR
jgi:DNA-binding winged helix-turn-helix (wHTH) protein